MIPQAGPISDFISQLLGLWLSVLALAILLNLFMVKRNANKDLQVYKLFLYVAGLSFLYTMALTLVHHAVGYYHRASEVNNYVSTGMKAAMAFIFAVILYAIYTKAVSKVNRRDWILLMLLGAYCLVSAFIGLFDYLA